ncbi:MAG: bifunctional DNA-formamidopyrimidine glycosylase/DNA-(apurinic or apyrimidinic site) lyase [Candidatus Berkelbacteria bacterium]|nr:MAG: bifunctional DNA-formamidopyrimidine glycosylase/DNA-(apurinic or apyrimidinic site) lyase [Candidatus Berkelbacteria bacterium]QQG51506.1 MAG: bifunctional DNA-formamidopyrimidine glycosylase/DNA-(apurinic or apyrimidinic site) lyase [Candidatus Berkelbacteria bacterium]
MPELPEVETVKRSLDKAIKGQTIKDIEVRDYKIFRGKRHDVIGAKINEIERRAKTLIWRLSNGKFLLFHLKMTGQMLYDSDDHKQIAGGGHPDAEYLQKPPHKHTYIIFTLDKGHLYFNDLRKFGWIKVLDDDTLKQEVAKYGPEVDWPEFSFQFFTEKLKLRPRMKIKTMLMDQSFISGIGNIYSDEILFKAKILPTRPVKDLSEPELRAIYDHIKPVLELAIEHGGTTLKDYRKLDGSIGDFLQHANVYHRHGQPCKVCSTKIERIVVNGRSAHFCPNCQK